MYLVAIGEAAGTLAVLALPALGIVWLGRHSTNQYVVHGIAILAALALASIAAGLGGVSLFLTLYASAHVAILLQLTYRKAVKLPPSGLARLYAVFAGILVILGGAVAIGSYADIAASRVASTAKDHDGMIDPSKPQRQPLKLSDVRAASIDWSQYQPVDEPIARNGTPEVTGTRRIRWLDEEKSTQQDERIQVSGNATAGGSAPANRFAKYRDEPVQQGNSASGNPYDRFAKRDGAIPASQSPTQTTGYGEYDPWIPGGIAGGVLWLVCTLRFLMLWVWRGFRASKATS